MPAAIRPTLLLILLFERLSLSFEGSHSANSILEYSARMHCAVSPQVEFRPVECMSCCNFKSTKSTIPLSVEYLNSFHEVLDLKVLSFTWITAQIKNMFGL